MSWWALVKAWRLFGGAASLALAMGVVFLYSGIDVAVPAADGLRRARHFVVAWLPVLLGTCLIDPHPELTGTLPRERRFGLVMRVAVVACTAVPIALSWWLAPVGGWQSVLYDVFVTSAFLAWIVGVTPKWGVNAVLGGAFGGMLWIIVGDSLAVLLGFASPYTPIGQPAPVSALAWALTAASVAAILLVVVQPSRFRRSREADRNPRPRRGRDEPAARTNPAPRRAR